MLPIQFAHRLFFCDNALGAIPRAKRSTWKERGEARLSCLPGFSHSDLSLQGLGAPGCRRLRFRRHCNDGHFSTTRADMDRPPSSPFVAAPESFLSAPQTGPSMKIPDFLSPANVVLDVRASDKSRLLQQLSTQAANELGLDPDEVFDQIAKREELGSTGVGNGVALPHTRLPSLKAPFGLLARLRHGIDFEAIDGQLVDVVFLLLLPETGDGAQLNALASVARALREPDALRRLRQASDGEALYRAIAEPSTQSG